jgi:HEAT repeat protein
MFFDPPWQKIPDSVAMVRKKDIPGLIRLLSSRNPEIQSDAIRALGSIGSDATETLIILLKKKNRTLRLGVIGALAEIKDARAVSSLCAMLHDPGSEIRWQAAIALGEIGDPQATISLLESLRDPDKYVRYGSAISLLKVGYKPSTDAEWTWYFIGIQDWKKVITLGKPALQALISVLKDTDSQVRVQAIRALGDIGDRDAGPALIRSLGDENRQVRWEAVLASQKCGVPPMYLPRGLCQRPRLKKNPLIAGFLNFLLPGLGYGYLGKWWGIMIFQIDITLTVWLFKIEGESRTYSILFPFYILLAVHAWYITKIMPEEPP